VSAPASAPPRVPLLERLGLHRRELRAWAMYDWANSAMVTVVISTVFPEWFRNDVAAGHPDVVRDYGLATTLAIGASALLGPLLGTLGDLRPWKKRLLVTFQLLAVAASAALAFVQPGQVNTALWLFAIANVGAASAFVFYDALLPHVARDGEIDRVSTAGYALGYVGGGLALALVLAAVRYPHAFGLASAGAASRAGFALVAVWWVVFSIPLLRGVAEPPVRLDPIEVPGRTVLAAAFRRLGETLRELRRSRDAFVLMIAFLLYNDGIGAVIRLAALVGADRGIPQETLFGAILVVQFVGIPCAFAFGALAGRIGAKRCILGALAVYVVVTFLAARMSTSAEFWVLALLVGAVMGGAQALSRSLFASMVPRHKSSEFFGLFGVCEKFAGVAGPGLFTVIQATTHDTTLGVLSLLPFFAAGAWLLLRVDVDRGRAAARAADAAAVPVPATTSV
jgi:MFS transporter, UMF1 family